MKSTAPISIFHAFPYQFLVHHGGRRFVLPLLLVSGLLVSAATTRASTVGCSGASGGPFDFPTLNAALSAPGALTNNAIFVSGTCTEFVLIVGAQNLQIIGNPGAAIVDPGDQFPPTGGVIEIDNSQGATLRSLSIHVAARPLDSAIAVVLLQSSDVRIFQSQIEGASGSDGIDMFQSTLRVFGGTIENNNDGQGDGEGIFIQGPNALLILRADFAGNCPVIQGNGDAGINANEGGTTVRVPIGGGCATIQNNGAEAIFGNLGATIVLFASQANPGSIKLLNNGIDGLIVVNGAHFTVGGPVLIQGNPENGIRLRNAYGVLTGSDGIAGPIIQQNGTSLNPPCCAPAAGVSLGNNATLDLNAGQVMNNGGPGVIAQDNSSVRVIGQFNQLSITNNPVGVEVTDASSAALFMAPSISGNTGGDVVCGPDAVAHGDLAAVGKINCPQFRPQQNAVAPPKHGKPIP
jgi:hypothetical protein